ncbi:odorant receptor 67c-like [Diabrotica virgifera virgifera]|uniref:Odorant receptor n=1 Tax=Diabrotica virgifera virgifera TaxID=50390 RepID=A0ABM5KFC5_DIAVI|nr:odorant receptor 67c-like [Diabrotica virgifera virgifera]
MTSLRARRRSSNPVLTREYRRLRGVWDEEYRNLAINEWRNCLFTDESRFHINNSDYLFFVYFCVGTVIYGAVPILELKACNERRISEEYRRHDPCGIPLRTWSPLDATDPIEFFVLMAIHTPSWLMIVAVIMAITLTLVVLGFLIHINAQLQYLQSNILHMFDEAKDHLKIRESRVRMCTEYHIAIIRYTKEVFGHFDLLLIVHVSLTSLIMGVLCFQMVFEENASDKLRYFLHLAGWVAVLFLTCYYGQLILTQSGLIGNAVYNSKWYNCPPALQKSVLLMILRSQRPLQLTAASISTLSLQTFLSIIKAAYSFFTLLLTMSK